MRTILHAKFGDDLAKPASASDKVPRTSPSPQLHNSSAEEFEAASDPESARDIYHAILQMLDENPDSYSDGESTLRNIVTDRLTATPRQPDHNVDDNFDLIA